MIMARILCTQRVHQGIQMSQGSANGNDSHGSLTNKTASQPTSPGETWLVTAQTLDIPPQSLSKFLDRAIWAKSDINWRREIPGNTDKCFPLLLLQSELECWDRRGGEGGGKCYETQLCWSCQTWDRGEKGVGTEFFSTNFFYAKTQI